MEIYIVFCNGSVIGAYKEYSNAVKSIAEETGYSESFVAYILEDVGNVDDFYYIETTNLE